MLRTIAYENNGLILLDQKALPGQEKYIRTETIEDVWQAIRIMTVRGAPLIGVTAAYGVYLGVRDAKEGTLAASIEAAVDYLSTARPTAVNLFWALERMKRTAFTALAQCTSEEHSKNILLKEAQAIHTEDALINRRIGQNLLELLSDGMTVLTHCNAGALATTAYGTALAPIYIAQEKGWNIKVYADETRPRLQGASLTAFELHNSGIDVTLITDNMAATVLSQGKIDAVIVGADRIAANGDTANKIGTLGVSILAKFYSVPFYVAAPISTIDINTPHGKAIPIEEREPEEVINPFGSQIAPVGVKVYNPAFDVTPAENITAIATERGLLYPLFIDSIKNMIT